MTPILWVLASAAYMLVVSGLMTRLTGLKMIWAIALALAIPIVWLGIALWSWRGML